MRDIDIGAQHLMRVRDTRCAYSHEVALLPIYQC